jgi:hypothetical protein
MKIILPSLCIALMLASTCLGAQRPAAEIIEYGIYSGGHQTSVVDTNAPTGKLLLGGPVKLEKQTTRIPARLKSKFGFRYVVHGEPAGAQVKLHFRYLFPQIKDQATGKEMSSYDTSAVAKLEDRDPQMLWDFGHPSELVPGEWTFQILLGERIILAKKFEVIRANAK